MPHPSDDDLALLALGETLPGVAAHVATCVQCTREHDALRAAVRTARAAELVPPPPAPEAVWDRIAAELDLPVRRPRRRRLLVGVAAAVAGLAVLAGVLVAGLPGRRAPVQAAVQVALTPLGSAAGTGSVRIVDGGRGREMDISTSGLPRASGFYEVWLLDPANGHLVALGSLDDAGSAHLPVPKGVVMSDYPTVDVSQEPDDGNPAHSGDSVLRGRLRT